MGRGLEKGQLGRTSSSTTHLEAQPLTAKKHKKHLALVCSVILLSSFLAQPVSAIKVLAFGDSLTAGVGDPGGRGYPPRLERKLIRRGVKSQVLKFGVAAEPTVVALTRADEVLKQDGDVFLLLEGTNDVNLIESGELSVESTITNIEELMNKARQRDIEPVLATTVPRSPRAFRDRSNIVTRFLINEVRELAFQRNVRLADAFQLFDPDIHPDFYTKYYDQEPSDTVGHPDEEGYDKMAEAFADVLLEVDTTSPVIGNFDPGPLPNEVPGSIRIRVPVYEPKGSSGLALAETKLLINGREVTDGVADSGTQRKTELVHRGAKALGCRAVLQITAEDTADPPNRTERIIALYNIEGRRVLDGDVDFDCRINGADLVSFALRFGLGQRDENYNILFDFNRDGRIDGEDFAVLASNFGRSTI